MDLFRKLGRQVEQFKRTAKEEAGDAKEEAETPTEEAESDAEYRCQACEERFSTFPEECPECGSERIEATESNG